MARTSTYSAKSPGNPHRTVSIADYYNWKGCHLILQGTVDHAGRFIDAYVGWSRRIHICLD